MDTPGHYALRATATGYRLSWVGQFMTINIDERGGHGPIEELYAHADQAFHATRDVVEREAGSRPPVVGEPRGMRGWVSRQVSSTILDLTTEDTPLITSAIAIMQSEGCTMGEALDRAQSDQEHSAS